MRSNASLPRGPSSIYEGEGAARICDWMLERGGALTPEDFAAYEVIRTRPVEAPFRGRQVLTNPPPFLRRHSISYALDLLERSGDPCRWTDPNGLALLAEVMTRRSAHVLRSSIAILHGEGFAERFLSARTSRTHGRESVRATAPMTAFAHRWRTVLGSTTHISVLDARAMPRGEHAPTGPVQE